MWEGRQGGAASPGGNRAGCTSGSALPPAVPLAPPPHLDALGAGGSGQAAVVGGKVLVGGQQAVQVQAGVLQGGGGLHQGGAAVGRQGQVERLLTVRALMGRSVHWDAEGRSPPAVHSPAGMRGRHLAMNKTMHGVASRPHCPTPLTSLPTDLGRLSSTVCTNLSPSA